MSTPVWFDHPSPWYEDGDYDGTQCRCCGRQRVMVCDAPDGSQRRVCEKCRKDQETGDYAALLMFSDKAAKDDRP